MQVYSRIVGTWATDVLITHTESTDYTGAVAECKKDREAQEQNTKDARARTKANTALQNSLQAETDPFRKSLTTVDAGGMTNYARAAYGNKLQQIADTYNNIRQMGLRGLSFQGGAKPVGLRGSIINTANENQATAEGDAYTGAIQDSLNQGITGTQIANEQQQIHNPEAAANTATNSAVARSRMGSTIGDIGAGIGQLAEVATSLSGAGGLKGVFKSAWGGKQG